MLLIAITGPIASGKSTAANYLCSKYSFGLMKFAAPLKRMLISLGLTYGEIEGKFKEEPSALLGGKTPRHAMQTLGTEWGRDLIDKDLWINAFRRELEEYKARTAMPRIVIDDARFPNEFEFITKQGGHFWNLDRWDCVGSSHESESYSIPEGYTKIDNNVTVVDLQEKLDSLVIPLL